MADYYYAELLFDPNSIRMVDLIERSINTLIRSGCEFREIVMPKERFSKDIKWGEFSTVGLDDLHPMCEAVTNDAISNNLDIISFPPGWGRVMFEYMFAFEDVMENEIWDEEEESNALSTDLGISFAYNHGGNLPKRIKMTISFWEDFVLTNASPETNMTNMRQAISFMENLCTAVSPFFCVMNKELHVNIDRSLDKMIAKQLPEGNEYVMVGKQILDRLDMTALNASSHRAATLKDGSLIIEFTDRWAPYSALG